MQSPAKDPHRQLQGAMSRARGQSFEQLIEAGCDYYRAHGIADIEKTPEPMQPTQDLGGGRFIAHFTKAAQADFKGVLRGGRAINFEAKSTSGGRIEQSRVTETQAEKLDNTAKMGGVCFVLCSFGGRDFARVPWTVWRNMKAQFGRKYISPEDVEAFRVQLGPGGALLFLGGLEV